MLIRNNHGNSYHAPLIYHTSGQHQLLRVKAEEDPARQSVFPSLKILLSSSKNCPKYTKLVNYQYFMAFSSVRSPCPIKRKTHVTIKKMKNMVKCTEYIFSSAPIHNLLIFVCFCTGFIAVYTTEGLFFFSITLNM